MAVIEDLRTGMPAHRVDVLFRNMRPVQHHIVEILSVFLQPVLPALRIFRAVQHFDAHLLQRGGVGFVAVEVVADELHVHALGDEQLQILVYRAGTGVHVKVRHIVVHHKYGLFAAAAVARLEYVLAVFKVFLCQYILPLFKKLLLVYHLIGLLAGRGVRAVGDALKVYHHGFRLVYHAHALCAYHEGKVAVLIVGGREGLVEATQFLPQRMADHDRRAGNVVDVLYIIELRSLRVAQTAVIPRAAVLPQDAAGLLQPPVAEYQFGACHADAAVLVHQLHQRFQPALLYLRVVVQEEDVFALGVLCGVVAVAQKAQDGLVGHHAHVLHDPAHLRG